MLKQPRFKSGMVMNRRICSSEKFTLHAAKYCLQTDGVSSTRHTCCPGSVGGSGSVHSSLIRKGPCAKRPVWSDASKTILSAWPMCAARQCNELLVQPVCLNLLK